MNKNVNNSADALKSENLKRIESHKETAMHLETAAKYHQEAAKHHEEGNHYKAALSTITAQGHTVIANELQKDETKRHAKSTIKA